jgi:WD40 repeat protein
VTSPDPVRPVGADEPQVDEQNPWPGLSPFEESAHAFFNGRRKEIAELRRLVLGAPLTVVFGVSGLGKTSLLRAGLFPAIRPEGILPVYVRLDLQRAGAPLIDQVTDALVAELSLQGADAKMPQPGQTIWEWLHREDLEFWSERNQLLTPLFVLDQFEEAFTLGAANPDAIRRLRVDLADLIENRIPAALAERMQADEDAAAGLSLGSQRFKVLLSFREDFLPAMEGWKRDIPSIMRNRLRLLPMSGEQAFDAIHVTAPHLTDETVAWQIVRFVARAQEPPSLLQDRGAGAEEAIAVQPALLSVFCRELNVERKRRGHARITPALVQDQQEAILTGFYERSLEGLDRGVRVFIEDHLVLGGGARTVVAEEVALSHPGMTQEAIARLIDRRLLRREERGGVPLLELTHDVLTEPARQSRRARREREHVREVREAEEQARRQLEEAGERDRKELALRTAQAEAERARADLAERQAHFERRARRGLAAAAGVVTVLFVLAVLAGRAAWDSERRVQLVWSSAGYEDHEAESPDLALFFLGRAVLWEPGNTGNRAALVTLLLGKHWPLPLSGFSLPLEGDDDDLPYWAQETADGNHIAVVNTGGGVSLWRADGFPNRPEHVLADSASFFKIDEPGRFVLLLDPDRVTVWDMLKLTAGEDALVFSENVKNAFAAAAGMDPLTVAIGYEDGSVEVRREGAEPAVIRTGGSPVEVLELGRGATLLLTASTDGSAQIWDVASGRELARLEGHKGSIASAQFAENGSRILTACDAADRSPVLTACDDTVRLWRLPAIPATIQADLVLRHDSPVTMAQFTPDGESVVTVSDDNTARVWRVAPEASGDQAQPVQTFPHDDKIMTALPSPDGTRLLTASLDESVRVWNIKDGSAASEPMWHAQAVSSAVWTRDGERVITASRDATVVMWDVRPRAALFSSDESATTIDNVLGTITERDAARLASLAEAVSGYRLDEEPWWTRVLLPNALRNMFRPEDPTDAPLASLADTLRPRRADLDEMRRVRIEFDLRQGPTTPSELIGSWMFADRWSRTINPLSPTTVDRFVRERLEKDGAARGEAASYFPGHPALRGQKEDSP